MNIWLHPVIIHLLLPNSAACLPSWTALTASVISVSGLQFGSGLQLSLIFIKQIDLLNTICFVLTLLYHWRTKPIPLPILTKTSRFSVSSVSERNICLPLNLLSYPEFDLYVTFNSFVLRFLAQMLLETALLSQDRLLLQYIIFLARWFFLNLSAIMS